MLGCESLDPLEHVFDVSRFEVFRMSVVGVVPNVREGSNSLMFSGRYS
jgi:hypothetical protein